MSHQSRITRRINSLYIGKSTIFKSFLVGGVVLISAIFVWYTLDLIAQLQADTRSQVEKYVRMWQFAANSPTSGGELQFVFDEIIVKATFPIAVLDADRKPVHWRNIEGVDASDTSAAGYAIVEKAAAQMLKQNGEFPLYFGDTHVNYFCYGQPEIITQLRWMPFVEIGIVIAFLLVGFIGFQNIRRSEERFIWVGMAKETAHQLGTPITSLMGWLEVMETECAAQKGAQPLPLVNETVVNMQADVIRLQKIANRFGQIGSIPELRLCHLQELLQETVEYYRRRLPFEGKGTKIIYEPQELPTVALNPELLGWALENLIKNALQSVDPKLGRVRIDPHVEADRKEIHITIADNGRGIPQAAARKVFRAGFTTKKRGWGLGLTLVKRIVEEYHGGRVSLQRSKPGETVFEIVLPIATQSKPNTEDTN
ncbi:MAG: HAMP domain-containing sensor histidine kinase [bacterium]